MIVACHSISKSFNDDLILKDVQFHIENTEKVALVGNNGAGKTTLFRILTGELSPDMGDVFIAKDTRIGYLHQSFHFDSSATVYDELLSVFQEVIDLEARLLKLAQEIAETHCENLTHTYDALRETFEQKKGYEYKSLVKGVLKGLGFDHSIYDQPIHTLSGGQKTRVALGKLLLEAPDVLLLDEPTNHLDIQATEWLESYLKAYQGAVIVISHDRYFLDKVVTKVVHLEFGKSYVYHGNYSYFLVESEKFYAQARHTYEKQQEELDRQKQVIAKLRQFNREKSIKRAKSREKLLAKQELVAMPMIDNKPMNLILSPQCQSGNDVLTVKNLKKCFDAHCIFNHLTFDIKRGEKVAIVGPNGVGKTTLFKMIMGTSPLTDGSLSLGTNVCIGYYDQEHHTLNPHLTIFDEIREAFPTLTDGHIRNMLAAFLFTGDDVFKTIASLSGGEKGRVALAKIMLSKANFLILDEPTNHLDMLSKEVLENAINHYEGTVLYVSHDRYFINQTATKVLEMATDHVTTYLGDYDYYVEKKKNQSTPLATEASLAPTKTDWKKQKELQNRIKKLNTLIASTLELIEEKEAYLCALDEQLCLEEVYTDAARSQSILNDKASIQDEITNLYSEWEALSEELQERLDEA